MNLSSPITSQSPEETQELGKCIARTIQKGEIVCLTGDLGAGKTTLVKGLAQEITGIANLETQSPTFTYLNIYSGKSFVYHFDLYRLSSDAEFIQAGFVEFLSHDAICCVEWPDRLPLLTFPRLTIHIAYTGAQERVFSFQRSTP